MPRTIDTDLEALLGKSITDLCPQGFHDAEANHCAHFVAHLGGYQFGYLCHHFHDSDIRGVTVRVQEIFPNCPEVGRWDNLPETEDDLLVFITARRNVDLTNKTIRNVPRKHIGILREGKVYHYSNGDDEIVRHTPAALRTRFRRSYRDETVDLFFGTLPQPSRAHGFDRPVVTEEVRLRTELLSVKEQIEDLLDTGNSESLAPRTRKTRSRRAGVPGRGRLAIVVGHTARSPGASGLSPVDPHEYSWNSDLAKLIKEEAGDSVECKTFFRDDIGISGAYRLVANWQATAAIELHYNSYNGSVQGTETLYGPACSRSEPWAEAVQSSMVDLYERQGRQDRGLKKAPPYGRGRASVNALTEIPTCLIEPFFGDNRDDARLGGRLRKKLAQALVEAFRSHFALDGPATAPESKRSKTKRRSTGRSARSRRPHPIALAPYTPPSSAEPFIGDIDLTPAVNFQPGEQLLGLTDLRILDDGIVFLDSDLSTDADGSPRAPQIDRYGQLETAYNFSRQTGQARYVNAETIPYVVLPGSNYPDRRPRDQYLYRRLGLRLGDLAAVIWNDRIEFAMLADAGPNDHIGEGSIALVESLGWNPWNPAGTQIVSGIPGPGVLTFFFPGSKVTGLTPRNAAATIRARGAELFRAAGGRTAARRSAKATKSRRRSAKNLARAATTVVTPIAFVLRELEIMGMNDPQPATIVRKWFAECERIDTDLGLPYTRTDAFLERYLRAFEGVALGKSELLEGRYETAQEIADLAG